MKFKLVLIVLCMALVTYTCIVCEKRNEELLQDIYVNSLHSTLVLSDMADDLNHSNNSYLRIQLIRYAEHANVLEHVFSELYTQTKERKYYLLFTATSDIDNFLIDVSNDNYAEMVKRVKENVDTLKRIGVLFKELLKYRKPEDIPEGLAMELFNASRELR